MARIRTIKPEFWTSEQVMECQPLARLLFIGIWNFCDDGGNHPLSEKTLKALVFPGDDITSTTVRLLLDDLSNSGLVTFYEHSGKHYLHVNGWRHQKIEKKTYRYPRFLEECAGEDSHESGGTSEEPQKPGLSPESFGDQSATKGMSVDDESSSSRRVLDPGKEGIWNGVKQDQDQEQGAADAPPAQVKPVEDKSKRGTRIDKDWSLSPELAAWAKAERPELDDRMIRSMADGFRDFWVAKTGKNATKLDWSATWRNWVRNQRIGGLGQRAGPMKPSTHLNLDHIDHEEGLERQSDGTYRIARAQA